MSLSVAEKHVVTTRLAQRYRRGGRCEKYVEQKNWSVVRCNLGYARFDIAEELAVLRNGIHAQHKM